LNNADNQIKDTEIEDDCLDDPGAREFLESFVNFRSELLDLDFAPLAVSENTSLAKVHFIFIMLGVMQLYLTRKGKFQGIITKECFMKRLNM